MSLNKCCVGSGSGGGSGAIVVDNDHIFTGANIAACEAARDAYFVANPDELVDKVYVILEPSVGAAVLEQYRTDEWVDVSAAVGIEGPAGPDSLVSSFSSVAERKIYFQNNKSFLETDLSIDVTETNTGATGDPELVVYKYIWTGADNPSNYDDSNWQYASLGTSTSSIIFDESFASISSGDTVFDYTTSRGQTGFFLYSEIDENGSMPLTYPYFPDPPVTTNLAGVSDSTITLPYTTPIISATTVQRTVSISIIPLQAGQLHVFNTTEDGSITINEFYDIPQSAVNAGLPYPLPQRALPVSMPNAGDSRITFEGINLSGGLQTEGAFSGETTPFMQLKAYVGLMRDVSAADPIATPQRTFIFHKDGDDEDEGHTQATAKLTISACVDAVNLLTPPISKDNPAVIRSSDTGVYSNENIVLPDFIILYAPNISIYADSPLNNLNLGNNCEVTINTVESSGSAGNCINISNKDNCVINIEKVICGASHSALFVEGNSEDIIFNIGHAFTNGDNKKILSSTGDSSITSNFDKISLLGDGATAFDLSGSGTINSNVGICESSATATDTVFINSSGSAGSISINANSIQSDYITENSSDNVQININSGTGSGLFNNSGTGTATLNCNIINWIGSQPDLNQNGFVNGIINNIKYGSASTVTHNISSDLTIPSLWNTDAVLVDATSEVITLTMDDANNLIDGWSIRVGNIAPSLGNMTIINAGVGNQIVGGHEYNIPPQSIVNIGYHGPTKTFFTISREGFPEYITTNAGGSGLSTSWSTQGYLDFDARYSQVFQSKMSFSLYSLASSITTDVRIVDTDESEDAVVYFSGTKTGSTAGYYEIILDKVSDLPDRSITFEVQARRNPVWGQSSVGKITLIYGNKP